MVFCRNSLPNSGNIQTLRDNGSSKPEITLRANGVEWLCDNQIKRHWFGERRGERNENAGSPGRIHRCNGMAPASRLPGFVM